jgi:hypothetical protein
VNVFLASVTLGVGYLIAFAAIFDGGKYAVRPWKALSL